MLIPTDSTLSISAHEAPAPAAARNHGVTRNSRHRAWLSLATGTALFAIGLTAGIVCFFATQFMKRTLKIDDSLDVFPVHGVGGFTGLLLTAVFSATAFDGLGLPDGVTISDQFVTQLIGAVATAVWSGVATFVILKVVNVVAPLRASAENENEGLDLVSHGESGYSL